MNLTRFEDAPEYFPPNHFSMRCVRLQGHEAGPSDAVWLGVSMIEPGGYTTSDASPVEKHYVVLEGEVVITTDEGEAVMQAFDSCRLGPGERRALHNRSASSTKILLVMPLLRPEHA
jgi:quercetin dioxygenase-like cupin family protein